MQESKPTVLVVDDNDGIRTLIATILRLSGFDAIACADGDEALGWLNENGHAIHLLITDVHLGPSLDGMELAQSLRAFYPSLKILYISGLEDREEVIREVESGRAFFLPKPFTPGALTAKVSAILGGKLSAAPAGRIRL